MLTDVVECVENKIEALHVRHPKLFFLDIAVVGFYLHVLVKSAHPKS